MEQVYKIVTSENFRLKSAVFLLSAGLVLYFFYRINRLDELRVLVYTVSLPGIVLTFYILAKSLNRFDIIIVIYTLIIIIWSSFTQDVSVFKSFMHLNVLTYLSIGLLAGKNRFPSSAAKAIFVIISGTILYFFCFRIMILPGMSTYWE